MCACSCVRGRVCDYVFWWSENCIDDSGAAALADALKSSTTVKSVDLASECRTVAGRLCASWVGLRWGVVGLAVWCFSQPHRCHGCGGDRGGAEVEHDNYERELG